MSYGVTEYFLNRIKHKKIEFNKVLMTITPVVRLLFDF